MFQYGKIEEGAAKLPPKLLNMFQYGKIEEGAAKLPPKLLNMGTKPTAKRSRRRAAARSEASIHAEKAPKAPPEHL